MNHLGKPAKASVARQERRAHLVAAALALIGAEVGPEFDPVHSPLSPVDVVMVAGAPWLADGLERDFSKDESGYRKIGGGANSPGMAYFFRSAGTLTHYLKRQGFYIPRGAQSPSIGMACFLDWDDRGRFNFTPDRSGIIVGTHDGQITDIVVAIKKDTPKHAGYVVDRVTLTAGDEWDKAIIGYSDLP